ncbi:hypothetical protein PX699_13510 [Sphingobium sp. H39-3-25]|uniref:hypothetical protein n=1 Tax=Sphingobium arseniciresistens TaxID=3030834 RepID=UPI0023B8C4D5|nr:hypothetical protein [Sphingobium arseniciresistens]
MFKPRPYDPLRKYNQTPAQQAATIRNFNVFKLHGLHAQMGMLTGPRRELARMLVDQELQTMGADSVAESRDKAKSRRLAKQRRALDNQKCSGCGEKLIECDCIPF